MEFRTPIKISAEKNLINHEQKLMVMGSCFSQNIGEKFAQNKFDICHNPFGIIYNPASIAQAVQLLIEEKTLSAQDLIFCNEQYHSFYHHGSFSQTSQAETLQAINDSLTEAAAYIKRADCLIVTFGTAYVYKHIARELIVSNCHKLPAKDFTRYRMSVGDIVSTWSALLENIKGVNPNIRIIFTVSPIRHLRDGMHANQLSKATLLLAIEELQSKYADIDYFPAYEIVVDDLRDYRFYADDMVHPNTLAVQYIWEQFSESFFGTNTQTTMNEWAKIQAAIDHRPFRMESDESQQFFKQTLLRLEQYALKYPYICVSSERLKLESNIN